MGGPRTVPDEDLRRSVEAFEANGRNYARAARAIGVPRATLQGHVKIAAERKASLEKPAIELPDFPDEDISALEDLQRASRDFEIRRASHEAHTWFKVKVRDTKPIGVVWFGDMHVDDIGCNTPKLLHDAELCRITEGVYGVNVGDTTNNWAGRLMHLYANQNCSKKRAQKRAEWAMFGSGIRWLVWLIGNHDAWGDGEQILRLMAKRYGTQKIIMHDWEARFSLAFQNGWEPRINAAHNFKGHSQWNPNHGLRRQAMLGEDANLIVAGDKHLWHWEVGENAERRLDQTLIRVRGYKYDDEYARRGQYAQQMKGCSILTIFDPARRSIRAYDDLDEGVDFLTWKRGRA